LAIDVDDETGAARPVSGGDPTRLRALVPVPLAVALTPPAPLLLVVIVVIVRGHGGQRIVTEKHGANQRGERDAPGVCGG
jgi:hypothetical protein